MVSKVATVLPLVFFVIGLHSAWAFLGPVPPARPPSHRAGATTLRAHNRLQQALELLRGGKKVTEGELGQGCGA
jgi:hypothetical protein